MKKKIGITLAVIVLLVCMISVVALAGCNKVKADNAQEASEANWAKKDSKTATTSVTITDAKIALGVEGEKEAISITASAKVDLNRKWENGTLTIDIVAQPQEVKLEFDDTFLQELVNGFIGGMVNFDNMSKIKFTGQAFYNYGGEMTKNIGVRNLKVEGLTQAIPALKEIITEDPWPIYFDKNRTKSEVSYDVTKINGLLAENPTIGGILEELFKEDYTLDVVSIIDDLLLNQTLLDFSDPTNANLTDGQYTNTVSALDNLNFLMDVWNNITDDYKEMLTLFTKPGGELPIGDGFPLGDIVSIFLSESELIDLLPNLLDKAVTDGRMSVTGTVEDNMFKDLHMTTTGVSIDLDNAQVTDLIGVIQSMLPDGGIEIDGKPLDIAGIINAIADGSAYVRLGTIKVDSSFTW